MKIKVLAIMLAISLCFNSIAFAYEHSYTESANSSITLDYKTRAGKDAEVTIKSKVLGVNAHPFISIQSLEDLNREAKQFVFSPSYLAYNGYIITNFAVSDITDKVELKVNERRYAIYNKNWVIIKEGELTEAPVDYDDEFYIPLEIFDLLGYSAVVKDGNAKIDLLHEKKKKEDYPYINSIDRSDETLILTKNGKDIKFRMIGVNLPDNDDIYNEYTADYINSLKGMYVDVQDVAASDEGFFYAYLYLIDKDVSINEDMVGRGYSYYEDYGVEDKHKDTLLINLEFAKANQLGVYHAAPTDPVRSPKKSFQTNGKVFEVVSVKDKFVTLKQADQEYKIDFGDRNISDVMKRNASLSLKAIEKGWIGKKIELLVEPIDNYEFVLYFMVYIKDHKGN